MMCPHDAAERRAEAQGRHREKYSLSNDSRTIGAAKVDARANRLISSTALATLDSLANRHNRVQFVLDASALSYRRKGLRVSSSILEYILILVALHGFG